MRRRRVLVVWSLLAALAAVVAATEYRDVLASRAERAAAPDARLLVPLPAPEIGALEIADARAAHRFERDPAGAWFYHGAHGPAEAAHTHPTDAALARRIDQAVQAFARTRVERRLPGGADPGPLGLKPPRMVVLVYSRAEAQPRAQYAVGDVAPDTLSRYVDVVGGGGIVTIPGYQVENLLALVDAVRSAPPPR